MGQPVNRYDFQERMLWSQGFQGAGIGRILRDRIPGCHAIEQAQENADRSGTDYWALRQDLPPLSIDVKVRSKDCQNFGNDDLALETWSVLNETPGWTRNEKKRTDFVLWFWQDTGRFFLISFPALCKTFSRYWQEWSQCYCTAIQDSGNWRSECVFVPRSVVIAKVNAWREGVAIG